MNERKIVTRRLIADRIDSLFKGAVSVMDFGEEMFSYLAFDEKYEFEQGYESLLREVLNHFSEMHDADKKDCAGINLQYLQKSNSKKLN